MTETPITDPTGGKKADWERSTKPVMWTDEEAKIRINHWLNSKDITLTIEPKNQYHYWTAYDLSKGGLPDVGSDSLDRVLNIAFYHKYFIETPDSLLHDLNIIKPIGRIEYESKWIDKILSGQKTMDILPIQHACGHYELWDTDRQVVRGIVEVTQIEKLEMCLMIPVTDVLCIAIAENYTKRCGFDCWQSLITYHRTPFQSVKYAITYQVVDMKGDVE